LPIDTVGASVRKLDRVTAQPLADGLVHRQCENSGVDPIFGYYGVHDISGRDSPPTKQTAPKSTTKTQAATEISSVLS
jgi:hypothetical protein